MLKQAASAENTPRRQDLQTFPLAGVKLKDEHSIKRREGSAFLVL